MKFLVTIDNDAATEDEVHDAIRSKYIGSDLTVSKVPEVTRYWDRLQRIKNMARVLQSSPIPDTEIDQQLNLMRLGHIEYELNQMVEALPH